MPQSGLDVALGAPRPIGVNLFRPAVQTCDLDEVPGSWQMLFGRRRHTGLSTLGTTLIATPQLYSDATGV